MYSYFFMRQIFKIKLACQNEVTEVNNKITSKISSRCILLSFERDISTF